MIGIDGEREREREERERERERERENQGTPFCQHGLMIMTILDTYKLNRSERLNWFMYISDLLFPISLLPFMKYPK